MLNNTEICVNLRDSAILTMEKVKNLKMFFSRRKKTIAVIVGWIIVISLIMIKSHQLYYAESEKFASYKISWLEYEGPKFDSLDLTLLLITSFLVGVTITNVKHLVCGYFATMFLSFLIGVVYVFLYDWFILTLGEALSDVPFGWEWGFHIAFLNIFRFMFPMGMFSCLIGVIMGSYVRTWLKT